MFDTGFAWEGNHFDGDIFFARIKNEYDAFFRTADITSGRYPVIIDAAFLFESLLRHFSADMYVSGASLLSGKLGEKVFSDKLSISDDMNPATAYSMCFF